MNQSSPFIDTFQKWMHVVMHNSMLNLTRFARENGYSMSQLMALNFISRKGPCGITDLGEEMGISSPAASQLLDRLVQHKLILRTEDPKDRRSKLVALTDKGQQIITESLKARNVWLTELESTLSHEENGRVLEALDLLIEHGRQITPLAVDHAEIQTKE
jgi:DNA-binding MarR family transcriptional regulator